VPGELTLTLTEGLHAPAHARAWVNTRAVGLPSEVRADALLIVSELVTNAVRHGRPEIVLAIEQGDGRLRIAVRDHGDALPIVPAGQPSIDRPTGRGLLIVAATATDWGVERHAADAGTEAGKTVWAEIAWT
jgi:anti-sigma regulatory factor (Ser/Thr protein kinase)